MLRRILVIGLCLLALEARPVPGQTITIRDDHFEVNGAPKFLLFISYFDAMRRANVAGASLATDFAFFRGKVDGIRILVNWNRCTPPNSCVAASDGLLDSNGALRDTSNWSGAGMNPWARFIAVLDAAKSHELLVDVTFDRDTIASPPSNTNYAAGIRLVIARLEADHPGVYRHIIFDMQNEWTAHAHTDSELRADVSAARTARSDAIVTGSQSSVAAEEAAAHAVGNNFDLLAFHDGRDGRNGSWYTYNTISKDIGIMRTRTSMPIVYDEPIAWCEDVSEFDCDFDRDDDVPSHFKDAAANAKKAGAAMWTFHTRESFILTASTYVALASSEQEATLHAVRTALDAAAWGIAPRRSGAR